MDQPKLYSKNKQMQTVDNVFVIEKYAKLIQWKANDAMVLDIGCGDGYTTYNILRPELPKNFKKLVGWDLSEKMIRFAKESYQEQEPRIEFGLMDISKDGQEDDFCAQYDHVVSFYCLHWVPEQRQAFKNIYKTLKPGGDMLISLVVTAPIFSVYENMAKNIRWSSYFRKETVSPYHNSQNPAAELQSILEEIGFQNCSCTVENRHYTFSSWQILQSGIIAVNPTIPTLTDTDKAAYISDFMEEVRKIYGFSKEMTDSGVSVPVDYKLLIAYARRPENS
ncbi:hypothetical protein GWI33_019909 [Rhynchophorus ferrugineus]|uniref:Methyltransferase domain-containing protein n=1 Tax=Rhynchophorus ferrugineus TaxID=354439 RepID=A0A834M0Y6_RHYFE|nr:hypothetical protein GWI33_019909 [Rhynchophorus ferrugineus]